MIIEYPLLFTNVMGFSLALIWNDTMIKVIDKYFPTNVGHIKYAVLITVLIMLIVFLINLTSNKDDCDKEKMRGYGLVHE